VLREPKVETRPEQPTISIPIEVTLREWGRANALVSETLQWLLGNGLEPAGPPFFRYHVIGDQDIPFRLDVGWPVGSAVSGDERVRAGVIPAGSYVSSIHKGHPDELLWSLASLANWITERGLMPALEATEAGIKWQGRYEFYLTNPEEQPDLDQWEIEIAYLLDDTAPGSDLPRSIGKPATRALMQVGIFRLNQLTTCREADILRRHGVGPKAIRILRETLAERGMAFAGDEDHSP